MNEKNAYSKEEITLYILGKFDQNYTDVCYITKETVQKLELTFKAKPPGLRQWIKPAVNPLLEEKKKVMAYA